MLYIFALLMDIYVIYVIDCILLLFRSLHRNFLFIKVHTLRMCVDLLEKYE